MDMEYDCSSSTKSSGFTILMHLVLRAKDDPDAEDKVKKHLKLYPISVNEKNTKGWTPLHLACRNARTRSSEAIVKILIDAGADVNVTGDSYTPLHMACYHSGKDSTEGTVKLLLDAGTNINNKSDGGYTALDLAHKYRDSYSTKETVKMLMMKGAEFSSTYKQTLHEVVRNNIELSYEIAHIKQEISDTRKDVANITDKLQVMIDYLSVLLPSKSAVHEATHW
jgi:ankyrin repeat protein